MYETEESLGQALSAHGVKFGITTRQRYDPATYTKVRVEYTIEPFNHEVNEKDPSFYIGEAMTWEEAIAVKKLLQE